MVKLQKRFAYNYKGKDHYKHQVIIPEDIIENLGWKSEIELEADIENNKLVFRKKKEE